MPAVAFQAQGTAFDLFLTSSTKGSSEVKDRQGIIKDHQWAQRDIKTLWYKVTR